jgi:anti-sigma factor RsiW
MTCEQAQELITGLIDNELSDAERSAIERHLEECPLCTSAHARERALKRQIRGIGSSVVAPAGLRKKVLSDPHMLRSQTDSPIGWNWLIQPFYRPILAAALLVIVVASVLYLFRPSDRPVSVIALQLQERIIAREVTLREARSQEELVHWLTQSVDGKFGPMVYDFSSINLRPVGGLVQEVNGRKMLVAFFRGESVYVSCFTFPGTDNDVPQDATVYFDPEKKMKFYSFSEHGIRAVLHREGDVICILFSNMPAEQLLSFVRDSSPHKHIRIPAESVL